MKLANEVERVRVTQRISYRDALKTTMTKKPNPPQQRNLNNTPTTTNTSQPPSNRNIETTRTNPETNAGMQLEKFNDAIKNLTILIVKLMQLKDLNNVHTVNETIKETMGFNISPQELNIENNPIMEPKKNEATQRILRSTKPNLTPKTNSSQKQKGKKNNKHGEGTKN